MNRFLKILWTLTLLSLSAMLLLTLGGCNKTPEKQPDDTTPPVDEQPDEQPDEDISEPEPAPQPQQPKYEGYSTPCIVETLYTEQNIVADAVVTDKKYKADPTGVEDATSVINKAIKAVYNAGGGTVYLPAGKYKVTGTIEVLPFVSLVGDYNADAAKDGSGDYGTVILACPDAVDANFPALFEIGGSACVVGLTVYYPEQDVNDVKPYPFTFSIPGTTKNHAYYMLSTIENITVINGYRGIYAGSVNEQMNIHDVRGTFLYRAMELYDSADASTIEYVDAAPEYWVNCPYDEVTRKQITSITKQNEAFVFGDVEWTSFHANSCTDYQTGIHIVPGPRAKFSGLFYNCHVLDCEYGMIVDDIDTRLGYGLGYTGGTLVGYEAAVINNTAGKVQLTGTEIDGELVTAQNCKEIVVNDVDPSYYPESDAKEPIAAKNFVVVKGADKAASVDSSDSIQKALDSLKETGGIVYLPAGSYYIENPLVIPNGVELRGAGHVPVRDQFDTSLGTIIFAHTTKDVDDPDSAQAIITLGKDSGLRNVRLIHANVDVFGEYLENDNAFTASPFLIRGQGDGCYVINSAFAGAVRGIEFVDADGYYVTHLTASAYDTLIRVNGSDHGYINTVLTNVTVGSRHGWWKLASYHKLFANGWEAIFEDKPDTYTTVHLEMDELTQLEYIDSQNCFASHVFSYGAKHTIEATNSTIEAFNIGKDCFWRYEVKTPMIVLHEDSELYLCNQHRFNGTSYEKDESAVLNIYSRVTIYADEGCVED